MTERDVSVPVEDDPNMDPNGVHPMNPAADGSVPPEHFHFNILKLARDAKQEFETRNPGKVASFFYAPEALLYLLDRSVKSAAFATGTDQDLLAKATVTQIFGMELISVAGTCITVTAEAIHDEDEAVEVTGIPMPPTSTELN